MSDMDMTDSCSEVTLETDNRLCPGKDDETLCQFREDFTQDQHNKHNSVHDKITSIIPNSIISGQLACQCVQDDTLLERSRSRSDSSEVSQNENSFKSKPLEKSKPGLPKKTSPQMMCTSTTCLWNVGNWNNNDAVVDHQCNDSCKCVADNACEYEAGAYQYQNSF